MILLEKEDFTGKYNIPDATSRYADDDVQEAIDKYEPVYIRKLFGSVLGNLIIEYLEDDQSPENTDYDYVIDPFSSDNSGLCGNKVAESLGLKEFLKACVFYEYQKNGLENTPAGVVDTKAETGESQAPASTLRFAENKFNDMIDTAEAIQWYCYNHIDKFPEFNGEVFKVKAANIL